MTYAALNMPEADFEPGGLEPAEAVVDEVEQVEVCRCFATARVPSIGLLDITGVSNGKSGELQPELCTHLPTRIPLRDSLDTVLRVRHNYVGRVVLLPRPFATVKVPSVDELLHFIEGGQDSRKLRSL